jgi:hypothetical protein
MTDKTTIRAWYVSGARIIELFNSTSLPQNLTQALSSPGGGFQAGLLANCLGPHILSLVRSQKIASFQQLALEGKLTQGSRFIYQGHFYGKGLGADSKADVASLSENVSQLLPGKNLVVEFSKNGLTTMTGRTRLSGSVNLFAFCSVTEIDDQQVRAVPYVIGDLVETLDCGIDFPFQHTLKLNPGDVDQFKNVDFKWNPTRSDFAKLQHIPEAVVKALFCKLFSEVEEPKDWGGEECDLFTSNLSVNGTNCVGSFMLKGPAKFHEMTPADCGKNGDQIYRLFNTPADIYVLQHCHKVSPTVRKTVEAYALAQHLRPCRYMIIDGYDTCRILKANGMLGN